MINKFNNLIHKYSSFFRFIFFLRYLFAIFLVSIALFLIIPNFFNYEKKAQIVDDYLFQNYNFKIIKYEKVEFQSLPVPKLNFKNVLINLNSSNTKLKVKNLYIYPNLLSIYDYENYQSKKLVLKDNDITLETPNLKILTKSFLNQKNKILIKNLNLDIYDKKKLIIRIKNLTFSNYGYNKNLAKGEVFGKKFQAKIENNFEKINFSLVDTGISADINFDNQKSKGLVSGIFKSKILKTNLKFNFNYKNKKLSIYNSYFRSKNLSFKNNSEIILKPFIFFDSYFQIEEFKFKNLNKISFENLLESKDIIKKINAKNEIFFKSKKFSNNIIDNFYLKFDMAYGRLNYIKNFSISKNFFKCNGNINFLEEYPLLFFDCNLNVKDKNKLLKKFSIKASNLNESLNIKFKGNISILNKKINFKKIFLKDKYSASKEDLKYFKQTFEDILFDKSFLEIFNSKKIREFILELS